MREEYDLYSLNYKPRSSSIFTSGFRNLILESLNPRIKGTGIRYVDRVLKGKQLHIQKYPWTIHPHSVAKWHWDIFFTLVLLFSLIENPLQIAFYPSTSPSYTLFMIFSLVESSLFLVDIFLNFITGIPDINSDSIILDKRIIARKYLKSWFSIDVLSSIPFDTFYYFVLSFENRDIYFFAFRILSLLKFLRIFRVIGGVRRIQGIFQITEIYTRLINHILTVLIVAHWLTCMHWFTADLFNPAGQEKPLSWIIKTKMRDEPVWYAYITCALRAHSNMVGNGYGNGDCPVEPEDILTFIFCSLIGFSLFGTYIGILGGVVEVILSPEERFKEMLTEISDYSRFTKLPKTIQKRLRFYYEQRYRGLYFEENNILDNVSDVLKSELLMYNCKDLIRNAPLFKELPTTFIKRIVQKLKFEVYLPNDKIIEFGNEGRAMYFIQEGKVIATTERNEFISIMEDGDHFGESSLVNDNQKTNANIIAKNYCDIYRLEKEDFQQVFINHPEVLEKIKSVARLRIGQPAKNLKTD